MVKFSVVLHRQEGEGKDSYFTHQNQVVTEDKQSVWHDFDEAQKAAMRARLQDPLNRRVTVKEF